MNFVAYQGKVPHIKQLVKALIIKDVMASKPGTTTQGFTLEGEFQISIKKVVKNT